MNSRILLSLVLIPLLAACAIRRQAIDLFAPSGTPSQAPTVDLAETPALQPGAAIPGAEALADGEWLWQAYTQTRPPAQAEIEDPAGYRLRFNPDGTLQVTADCNTVNGNYAIDGASLYLLLSAIELSDCGPESRGQLFLTLLSGVDSFQQPASLLVLSGEEGLLGFTNEGGALPASPPTTASVCAGIALPSIQLSSPGLAWQAECIPATARQPGSPGGLPEHIQIALYAQQVGRIEPLISIIPVAEYEALYQAAGDPSASLALARLKDLLAGDASFTPGDDLPALPYLAPQNAVSAAVEGVHLQPVHGDGLRYLGRFADQANPDQGGGGQLFYAYQGLTPEQETLVTFFFPMLSPDQTAGPTTGSPGAASGDPAETGLAAQAAGLDALIQSLQFSTPGGELPAAPLATPTLGAGGSLFDTWWMWAGLDWVALDEQNLALAPGAYTLLLSSDGTLRAQSPCQVALGEFSAASGALALEFGAQTRTGCADSALSDGYFKLLSQATGYQIAGDQLSLLIGAGVEQMYFTSGGPALSPTPPAAGKPAVTFFSPTPVYGVPGADSAPLGFLSPGASAEVLGKSSDGAWYAILLGAEAGHGWVSVEQARLSGAVPPESPP